MRKKVCVKYLEGRVTELIGENINTKEENKVLVKFTAELANKLIDGLIGRGK